MPQIKLAVKMGHSKFLSMLTLLLTNKKCETANECRQALADVKIVSPVPPPMDCTILISEYSTCIYQLPNQTKDKKRLLYSPRELIGHLVKKAIDAARQGAHVVFVADFPWLHPNRKDDLHKKRKVARDKQENKREGDIVLPYDDNCTLSLDGLRRSPGADIEKIYVPNLLQKPALMCALNCLLVTECYVMHAADTKSKERAWKGTLALDVPVVLDMHRCPVFVGYPETMPTQVEQALGANHRTIGEGEIAAVSWAAALSQRTNLFAHWNLLVHSNDSDTLLLMFLNWSKCNRFHPYWYGKADAYYDITALYVALKSELGKRALDVMFHWYALTGCDFLSRPKCFTAKANQYKLMEHLRGVPPNKALLRGIWPLCVKSLTTNEDLERVDETLKWLSVYYTQFRDTDNVNSHNKTDEKKQSTRNNHVKVVSSASSPSTSSSSSSCSSTSCSSSSSSTSSTSSLPRKMSLLNFMARIPRAATEEADDDDDVAMDGLEPIDLSELTTDDDADCEATGDAPVLV